MSRIEPISKFTRFPYEPHGPMMDRAPGLDAEYLAWHVMRQFSFRSCCQQVLSTDLVLELPGPIYLFLVHFIPRGIPEHETFIICGVLTHFQIDVPQDKGIYEDGKERILLYFAHLLIFCFCKPKYKTPFHLFNGWDSKRWPDDMNTRVTFVLRILNALPALGYKSLGDFMPILEKFTEHSVGIHFLDGNVYKKLSDDPMRIEDYINFDDAPAAERTPALHRLSKPFVAD